MIVGKKVGIKAKRENFQVSTALPYLAPLINADFCILILKYWFHFNSKTKKYSFGKGKEAN